ncbi:MAG: hypothetical protein IPH20_05030 [Bacteroidales bacterium]|nr:hypothetical protein [Bacteroidales bacterium]
MNNIDSIARSKLPDQGRLHNGFLKAYEGLMGGVCAVVNTKESERRGERDERGERRLRAERRKGRVREGEKGDERDKRD